MDPAGTITLAWLAVRPHLAAGEQSLGEATGAAPFQSGFAEFSPNQQLERLVIEHGEAVYRVALSVVRDPTAAEDVAQEALLKAWQALPAYRGDAPLRNWVLRITHNTAISMMRRRREDARDPFTLPEASSGETTEGSTERQVERRASIAAFEAALDGLDELSRAIVVLRELEAMSYEDIAELVGVPLPTVKTRLLRARRVLSVSLEEWRP